MDKSSSILITGGRGMAGKALLERLLREGHHHVVAPTSKLFDLRDPTASNRMFAAPPALRVSNTMLTLTATLLIIGLQLR
jgi:nucleoside-diphosphate-sugar epimerase